MFQSLNPFCGQSEPAGGFSSSCSLRLRLDCPQKGLGRGDCTRRHGAIGARYYGAGTTLADPCLICPFRGIMARWDGTLSRPYDTVARIGGHFA